MGIMNKNGNKIRLNLGSEMGMGKNHWDGKKCEGMELKKDIPAHLYY